MRSILSHRASYLFIFLLVIVATGQLFAQTSVDPTYNGVPGVPIASPYPEQQAIQSDGKILIWGSPLAIEGVAKGKLARLNSDGSLDNTFTYCNCGLDGFNNALPLPDGKILVAGYQGVAFKVARLNNDGSLDPTFNNANPPNPIGASTGRLIAVQSDGKFYAIRSQAFQGFSESTIFRFNPDGSLDAGFTPVGVGSGTPNQTSLAAFLVVPGGKLYVATNTFGGFGSVGNLRRFNPDGTVDNSWTSPNFQPSTSWLIGGLSIQSDGALIVSGDFSSVNGVASTDMVRILPAGNVDLNFAPPAFLSGGQVQVLANGKILFTAKTDISGINKIFRLNTNGSLDNTFTMDPGVTNQLNSWVLDANERIVFLGSTAAGPRFVRLLTDGSRDGSFNPDVERFGHIHALARQADGKVIAAGDFTRFNGAARPSIVRTNADGSLDPTFDAGTGFTFPPRKMIIQPDGKILVIGQFITYNGASVRHIVRLLPTGAIDPTFSATPNTGGTIYGIALQTDGKILVTGNFTDMNGVTRPGVARLNTDGSVDTGFNALLGGSPTVNAVVVQSDGKVVIGGSFSGVQGFNRSNFVRLDSAGGLDQSFNPSVGTVGGIWLTPDGKFLISGPGGDSITLQRRNSDGSPDNTYTSQTFLGDNSQSWIDSVLVQPDGSAIVGGNYYTVGSNARRNIVRLSPTGTVDALFLPRSADGRVRAVTDGGPGKILIGGDFSQVELVTRAGLARLNVAPFRKTTPFDIDGDGRADITVFRPSTNNWYTLYTSTQQFSVTNFGSAGDIIAPGDYDGDGKTDLGIYRPSTGAWWFAASTLGGAHRTVAWGVNGDIPRPSDYDGDGKTDYVLFRPSNSTWYRMNSNGTQTSFTFGSAGDIPIVGDFDGDGKGDMAVYRPSTGTFWYAASASGNAFRAFQWGHNGDIPVPGDYDGDGKTDFAIFRPSEGGWYIAETTGPIITLAYGLSTDKPVPADYDGDGKTDIAVFRPSTGVWYLLQSTLGSGGVQWGVSTDIPAPAAFLP